MMTKKFNENREAACDFLSRIAKDTSFTEHHKGFTTVPQKIHRCYGLSTYERMILTDLFGFMGNNHLCYPSQETLARNTGCSSKTIGRYLEALEKKGLILISNSQKHHTYYLPNDLHKNPHILMSEKTHEFVNEVRETVNDSNLSLWVKSIVGGEGFNRYLERLSRLMKHEFSFSRGEDEKRCLAEYKQYLSDEYAKKFIATETKSE